MRDNCRVERTGRGFLYLSNGTNILKEQPLGYSESHMNKDEFFSVLIDFTKQLVYPSATKTCEKKTENTF